MRKIISIFVVALIVAHSGFAQTPPVRGFMSHRGVHLKYTIAGENSLQAVDLAYRAGFWCIETDTRYTRDSVLVIMHDKYLNRTCTDASGKDLVEKVPVADITFEELRTNYRLRAARAKDRVVVPTLKEYLQHCAKYGFLVFIEPKLKDPTGRFYLDIIRVADEVLGRNGYVITSNNFANGVIRSTLGIKDVRLMGLLYQTDWQTMSSLGNIIFAVSSTEFTQEEYSSYVRRAHDAGYWVQSAAGLRSKDPQTDFGCFRRIGTQGNLINLIATDEIAPDLGDKGRVVASFSTVDSKSLEKHFSKIAPMEFSGLYFEISCRGEADVVFGNERVRIGDEKGVYTGSYQRMFFDCVPTLRFENATSDFRLNNCTVRVVVF